MGEYYKKDGKIYEKGSFFFPDREVGEIKTDFWGQPTQVNPPDWFTSPSKIEIDKSSGKIDVHKDNYLTGNREGFTIEKDITHEHNQRSTEYSYPLYPEKTSGQKQSGDSSGSGYSGGGGYGGGSASSASSSKSSYDEREDRYARLGVLLFAFFLGMIIIISQLASPPDSTTKKSETTTQNPPPTQIPQTTEPAPLIVPNQKPLPNQEIKIEKETFPEEITNRNTEVLPTDDSTTELLSPSMEFRTLGFSANYVGELTLTNNTEEYLPFKITKYPSYPFEIAENSCQNDLAPHTSCKIILKFRKDDTQYGSLDVELDVDLYKDYTDKIIIDVTNKKIEVELIVLVFYKGNGRQ